MKKLFKNQKVIVMGLGLHGGGVGVANFFISQGAKVLITDLKTKSQLKESLAKLKTRSELTRSDLVLGKHRIEDFRNADLIIKNPDVPSNSKFLKIARGNKIPIKSDIQLFFELCPAEIIGITGTKGKSTVSTLTAELLKEEYHTVLAGNIGVSPLEFLDDIKKNSKVVLELSSFILEDLQISPHIAVITNLFPDHLNRYKNFNEYTKAKKNIFKYQDENDVLILNKDLKNITSKSKIVYFDGENNSAAIAVAKEYKVPMKKIERVITTFKGVPHRQEFVADKKGVKYYNDTSATNPGSVKYALNKFENIILVAGGESKKLNYRALAKDIQESVKHLILLPGSASDLIERDLKKFPLHRVKSMKMAVKKASMLAEKGDTVILSPGAASFNLFKNEFDRGNQFKKEVKNL